MVMGNGAKTFLVLKSFEEVDLMIMRAIDQRFRTKSDWIRELIKRLL